MLRACSMSACSMSGVVVFKQLWDMSHAWCVSCQNNDSSGFSVFWHSKTLRKAFSWHWGLYAFVETKHNTEHWMLLLIDTVIWNYSGVLIGSNSHSIICCTKSSQADRPILPESHTSVSSSSKHGSNTVLRYGQNKSPLLPLSRKHGNHFLLSLLFPIYTHLPFWISKIPKIHVSSLQ